MKRFFLIIISLFLVILPCEAQDNNGLKQEHIDGAIHTYGGGEYLAQIFNALAMLLYGNSKSDISQTFNAIIRIALAIGGFSSICLALSRERIEPLIKQFFLPSIGVLTLLLTPRTSVYIQDHLVQKIPSTELRAFIKVDNVPFFLAKLATLVSSLSYELTNAFENVTHGTDDKMYNWTGHIYAGENIFNSRKYRIANPSLEANFREFCRECVFRDIGIGLYSREDLIKVPQLLQFLETHTSNIRTFYYKDVKKEGFITCKEAMKHMNEQFNGIVGNTRKIALGETGDELTYLLGQKEKGETALKNLIKQQIAISLLKEEVPGTLSSFAAKRAEILQKENQKTYGALAGFSIVALRGYVEGLVYAVFPLIIIYTFLSFGIKVIIHWIHGLLWVNTWSFFYVIVNFLLNATWKVLKIKNIGSCSDLTIFNSEGFIDLYGQIEGFAFIGLGSVPVLSWMLIRGGINQAVGFASSLMAPAQSAAATTAAESAYGNYSFGNVNLDSTNAHNAQMFKQSYSGHLSHDSIGIDTGTQTLTYASDGSIFLKQGDSYLREGISKTDAFASSLQDSLSSSQSAVFESSKAVSDGVTESANKGMGLMQAVARQMQHGENWNIQSSSSLQTAYNYLDGVASEYGAAKGISKDSAFRDVVSFGVGGGSVLKLVGLKADGQVSGQEGKTHSESTSFSEKSFDTETFQKHMQTIRNASSAEVASVLGSEDARLHTDFVDSFSKTESSMEQLRTAYSRQEALSNLKSYSESSNLNLQQHLNQGFIEFLQEKYQGDVGKVIETTELSSSDPEKRQIINDFIGSYLPQKLIETGSLSMEQSYQREKDNLKSLSENAFDQKRASTVNERQSKIGHQFGELKNTITNMENKTYQDQVEALDTPSKPEISPYSDDFYEKHQNFKNQYNHTPYLGGFSSTGKSAAIIYTNLFGSDPSKGEQKQEEKK